VPVDLADFGKKLLRCRPQLQLSIAEVAESTGAVWHCARNVERMGRSNVLGQVVWRPMDDDKKTAASQVGRSWVPSTHMDGWEAPFNHCSSLGDPMRKAKLHWSRSRLSLAIHLISTLLLPLFSTHNLIGQQVPANTTASSDLRTSLLSLPFNNTSWVQQDPYSFLPIDDDSTMLSRQPSQFEFADFMSSPRNYTSPFPGDQLRAWVETRGDSDALTMALPWLLPIMFEIGYASPTGIGQMRPTSEGNAPLISAGRPGSRQHSLYAALEDALIARHSPVAESALLLFTQLDDPALANKALQADYSELRDFPWLLSETPWSADMLPAGPFEPRFPNADKLLANIVFSRPYELPYSFGDILDPYPFTPVKFIIGSNERCVPADPSPPCSNSVDHCIPILPPQTCLESEQYSNNTTLPDFASLHATHPASSPEALHEMQATWWNSLRSISERVLVVTDHPGEQASLADALDQFIHKQSPAIGTSSISQLEEEAVSFTDLILAPQPNDQQSTEQTISFLVHAELQERALELYALLSLARSGVALPVNVDLTNTETILHDFSGSIHKPFVTTQVHDELDLAQYQKMNDEYAKNSPSCTATKSVLTARDLSLTSDTYLEHFDIICKGGTTLRVEYFGAIPIGFRTALHRIPRIFDFLDMSLAFEAANQNAGDDTRISDIELVQDTPEMSIPMLLAAIYNPSVPWRFVHEDLALSVTHDYWWLFEEPQESRFVGGAYASNLAPSDEAYQSQLNSLTATVGNVLGAFGAEGISSKVRPAVNALSNGNDVWVPVPCPPANPGGPPAGICGVQHQFHRNPIKVGWSNALDAIDAQVRSMQTELNGSVIHNQQCNTANTAQPHVRIVLRPDLKRYITTYSWLADIPHDTTPNRANSRYCEFGFERGTSLSDTDTEALRKALAIDPAFLERNQLDLTDTRGDSGRSFGIAISALLARTDRQKAGMRFLHQEALEPLFERDPLEPNGAFLNANIESSVPELSNFEMAMLTRTDEGLRYSLILRALRTLIDNVRTPNLLPNGVGNGDTLGWHESAIERPLLSKDSITKATEAYGNLVSKASAKADDKAQQIIQSIPTNPPDGWTIGIGIGFNGPIPFGGFSFSIGGASISLDFSGAGLPSAIPSWQGVKFPLEVSVPKAEIPLPNPTTPKMMSFLRGALPGFDQIRTRTMKSRDRLYSAASLPKGADPINTVVTWDSIPPVDWRPGEFSHDNVAGRAYLAGMIARAWPALSDEEKALIDDAIKQPYFPTDIADLVARRADQGLEIRKIQDREWFPTTILLDGLLPAKQPGRPCPISGCIDLSNDKAVDAYIDDFNTRATGAFADQRHTAEHHMPKGKLLSSDLPAISIAYGNDFQFLLITYTWETRSGTVMLERLSRTPYFLIDRVRKNPYGHVYEEMTAALGAMASSPNAPPSQALAYFETSFTEEFMDSVEYSKAMTDPLFEDFSKQIMQAAQDFWDSWTNHAQQESKAGHDEPGYTDPFIPPDSGAAFMKCFDPPWQYEWEENMTFDQWITYEENSAFGKEVSQGKLPPPIPILH
jgi:hypothetical protein